MVRPLAPNRALSDTAPVAEAIGSTAAVGAAGQASDSGHRHAMPAAGAGGDIAAETFGATVAAGASGKIADAAHRHAMPAAGVAVANVAAADATDEATAVTLANETKAQLNALLASLRTPGTLAT